MNNPVNDDLMKELLDHTKNLRLEHVRELSSPASHPEEPAELEDPSALELMETLLFYRAALMACSLAARSDTSKLLSFKNRDQVVRVL